MDSESRILNLLKRQHHSLEAKSIVCSLPPHDSCTSDADVRHRTASTAFAVTMRAGRRPRLECVPRRPPAPPSLLGPHSVVARMVSLSPLAAPLALLLWRLSPLSEIICPLCVCQPRSGEGAWRCSARSPSESVPIHSAEGVGEGEAAATYTKSVRPSVELSVRPSGRQRKENPVQVWPYL